jgi:phage tail sheath gpL-like
VAIGFAQIPADLKIPLFWAEFSNAGANPGAGLKRAVIIGQTTNVVPAQLTYVSNAEQADGLFGPGSQVAAMVRTYRLNDAFGELWVLPLADNGAGVAATTTLTVTGPSTAAGVLSLYIAGKLVSVAIPTGTAATAIATAIAAAITAAPNMPVTAAAAAAVVTLTARNKGTVGNDVDVRLNFAGVRGGEALPAGVGVAIVAPTNGATDPDLTTLDTLLGDEEFEVIIAPYSGATQLDALRQVMNDATGRWSWLRQVYGHVYSAKRGTAAALLSFGATRNDQHVTVVGFPVDSPSPSYAHAAAWGAQVSISTRADPARPMQTLPLLGILAPPSGVRFLRTDQQALLSGGIALEAYGADGTASISRSVTTYQRNVYGATDRSYLDSETMHLLAHIVRTLRTNATQKFPRSKLVNDDTRFGAGQPIVTPKSFKAELIAQYATMEDAGLVEDAEAFAAATIVERNALDPSRLDVLYAPDLANGLRIIAVLAEFRS